MAQIIWTETATDSGVWQGKVGDTLWFTVSPLGIMDYHKVETQLPFPCDSPKTVVGAQAAMSAAQDALDRFGELLSLLVALEP